MGILYIDGKADQIDLFRVPQAFRTVFGGEVSSKAITIKNPEGTEQQGYFCMQLNVEEIDSIDSFTKLKIERALKNLEDNGSFFKEIKRLKTTPDLDHIFSLNEQPTPTKDKNPIKEELKNIKREIDLSPETTKTTTTHETVSTHPGYDDQSDLSDLSDDDENNLPKFK
jgi:hypothetical protein